IILNSKLTKLFSIKAIQIASGEQQCGKLNETLFKNGELITELGEHPWIGHMQTAAGTLRLSCVAILIDDRHAIVPAHCNSIEPILVVFGYIGNNASDVYCHGECAPGIQKVAIEKISIHPDYEVGNFNNDLAIIQLKEKVVFTDHIQPICMPSAEDPTNQKTKTDQIVAGLEKGSPLKDHRESRQIKMPVEEISSKECHKLHPRFPEELICGATSLAPLSGSALLETRGNPGKFHLVGIVTAGFFSPEKKKEINGFENIGKHLDWILKNTSR
ncbi:hypothetical protein KR009_011872, partial [Drosophila setifemur]